MGVDVQNTYREGTNTLREGKDEDENVYYYYKYQYFLLKTNLTYDLGSKTLI